MSDWEDMCTSSDDEPINTVEENEEEEIDEWDLMVNDTFKAEREQALKIQNRNKTDVNYVERISEMEKHEIIQILKDIIKNLDVHSLTEIGTFINVQKNSLIKASKPKKKKNKKTRPKLKAGKYNDDVLKDMYYD